MGKSKLNLWITLFAMGAMTTLMGYSNSLLALGMGLFLSTVIVHSIGLIPSSILFITYEKDKIPKLKTIFKSKPLIFAGGLIGVSAVTLTSYCINNVGVFLTTLATLSGQLILSFIIDTFGLFGFKKVKVSKRKAISMLILLLGIILISK